MYRKFIPYIPARKVSGAKIGREHGEDLHHGVQPVAHCREVEIVHPRDEVPVGFHRLDQLTVWS